MMIAPIYGPIYLATLGLVDTRQVAIPLTLGSIAAVFASACYGAVHKRLGIAGVTVVSTSGMGIALIVAGWTGNEITFMAALVAVGALLALLALNLNASAVAFSTPHRETQAIGLANGAMYGCQMLFPFVAGWIRDMAGLNGVFFGFGLVMLVVGLTALAATALTRRGASAQVLA
ncbi:MFS transporter [Novosphingobium sp. G106]|nr:MFS transporter [Novosphingobium sp. G106]